MATLMFLALSFVVAQRFNQYSLYVAVGVAAQFFKMHIVAWLMRFKLVL